MNSRTPRSDQLRRCYEWRASVSKTWTYLSPIRSLDRNRFFFSKPTHLGVANDDSLHDSVNSQSFLTNQEFFHSDEPIEMTVSGYFLA